MKAKFLTTLDVRLLDSGTWQLLAPLVVVTPGMRLIRVPNGFETDFASVPRWIPFAFALFGNLGYKASTVHDYLYATGSVPREEADAIMRDLLEEEGAGKIRANLMYAGVRLGGASHYKET